MKQLLLIICLAILMNGCQKTPESSSIANRKNGLPEGSVEEALPSGETKKLDNPVVWDAEDEKSNSRMIISTNLKMGTVEVGNLPIIEMKNRKFSNEQLQQMVSYFSDDEDIYIPNGYLKEEYQNTIERIDGKEGAYGNNLLSSFYKELREELVSESIAAPDQNTDVEIVNIEFEDNGFEAEIGKDRTAHIEAESYNSKLENSSKFKWENGAFSLSYEDVQQFKDNAEYQREVGLDTTGYVERFLELLEKYETEINKNSSLDSVEGEKQAKKLLEDLDISEMSLYKIEKVLWFKEGAIPSSDAPGYVEDCLWQGDLEETEVGYQYTFLRYVNGIPAKQEYGISSKRNTESYIPPFPMEKITIIVTESGTKSFEWVGMTEKENIIAENTKLMSFNNIEKLLFNQIFYSYSDIGQPSNDTTVFEYKVISANLQYAYIPAFENPRNAWIVPVWVFKVQQTTNGVTQPNYKTYVLNAIDGGVVENAY